MIPKKYCCATLFVRPLAFSACSMSFPSPSLPVHYGICRFLWSEWVWPGQGVPPAHHHLHRWLWDRPPAEGHHTTSGGTHQNTCTHTLRGGLRLCADTCLRPHDGAHSGRCTDRNLLGPDHSDPASTPACGPLFLSHTFLSISLYHKA